MPNALNTHLRFGFLLHDVSRMRRIVIDRALKPLGITRSQWWLLAFLSRRDGMTQTALAVDLDLTKVAIGGLIERLEQGGLAERRADAGDARARRVYLTRAGHRLIDRIRASVDRVEAEIMAAVSVEEQDQTMRTLAKLKDTLAGLIDQGCDGEAEPAIPG